MKREKKIKSLMDAKDNDIVIVRRRKDGCRMASGAWYEDHILWYARRDSGEAYKPYEFRIVIED